PLQGCRIAVDFPRVAADGNPGLDDATPSGLKLRTQNSELRTQNPELRTQNFTFCQDRSNNLPAKQSNQTSAVVPHSTSRASGFAPADEACRTEAESPHKCFGIRPSSLPESILRARTAPGGG